MANKLYVGNLHPDMSTSDLQQLFSPHGIVESTKIVMNRRRTQSNGYGFVQMSTEDEAHAAIAALNGKDFRGRPLTVDPAKQRQMEPLRGSL